MEENIQKIKENIAEAAQKAGRDPQDIILIGVSKTMPLELVQEAYKYGIKHFGENYVQEAAPKAKSFHPEDLNWHFIGHLQTNKVSKIIDNFSFIHSVDSIQLAKEIDKQAGKKGARPTILLQVNIAGEKTKSGLAPEEVLQVAKEIIELSNINVGGLMTIAPMTNDPEQTRPLFQQLRELRDRLREELPESRWEHLSIGMTNDYKIAIEEGATMIRIGRAIFGERK